LDQAIASKVERASLRQDFSTKIRSYDEQTSQQVCNIGMLRDYRAQLRELKATAKREEGGVGDASGDAGAENVDPGATRGGRSCDTGGKGHKKAGGVPVPGRPSSTSSSIGGDMDTLDGQRAVLEALVQETEKAVDETQERLEMVGVELDDMCRRLGMGDSFQGQSIVADDESSSVDGRGDGSGLGPREFKALEGLFPVEARQLVTSLVEDATAAGIGDMIRREEAAKQAAEMAELRDKNKSMK
ncbi:unnamed protein product, partial [Ectocarpus sp. 12 AP-2014]